MMPLIYGILFRPVWMLKIYQGNITLLKGKLSKPKLWDCREIAVSSGIKSGYIWGVNRAGRSQVMFSPGIPTRCRQRFRNVLGSRL